MQNSSIKLLLKLYEEKRSQEQERENSKVSEFRHPHNIGGWRVESGDHANSQAHDRRPQYKKDNWAQLHSKVVNHIKKNNIAAGEHIFYSGIERQGYVARIDPNKKKIKVITVLPVGSSRAKEGTDKHIIESAELKIYILD